MHIKHWKDGDPVIHANGNPSDIPKRKKEFWKKFRIGREQFTRNIYSPRMHPRLF